VSGREDIARKLAPCPKNGVVEWPPSLQQCSACALFSYAGVDIRKVSKALGHSFPHNNRAVLREVEYGTTGHPGRGLTQKFGTEQSWPDWRVHCR